MDDMLGGIVPLAFVGSIAGMVLGLALEASVGPGSLWGIGPWIGALGIMGTGFTGGILVGMMTSS